MEIAAVGRDDFVQGFKLIGVRRTVASSKEDIENKIADVLEDPAVGILVLSTADMKGLSHSMRRRLETVARPVVISVGAAEDEDLRTKVRRAIGLDLVKWGGRTGGAPAGEESPRQGDPPEPTGRGGPGGRAR